MPEVAAVAAMLTAPSAAVESTIDMPAEAAGAVLLARPSLGLDRFFAAIEYPRKKWVRPLWS